MRHLARHLASVAVMASMLAAPLAAQQAGAELAVDARFTDLRWQQRRLSELGAPQATVVFFATVECPIVKRYLPRVGALAREFEAQGAVFVVANVGADDALVDAAAQVALHAPACVFAKDFDGELLRACGVDRSATCVVLDAGRRIVYRGRVDDQFGYSGQREAPRRDDLREALVDVLAGRAVATPGTEVSGCVVTPRAAMATATAAAPTFTRDVLPVMQRHCQECHRPGGQAPFSLLDEAEVRKHSSMIGEVVEQGRMPPWYGSQAHGAFDNFRGMSPAERATLLGWLAGGRQQGDAADAPAKVAWPEPGWRIGEPDLVLEVKTPIRIPADGVIPYRYFVLPFHFVEDTWVEAIEIKPDNPRVLHHCNLARVKLGERFSQEGFVTGYVPGGDPMVLDPGTAVRMPAGSALALQAHYVTTGDKEIDRLKVGLRFPRTKVQKELKVTIAADFRFQIPPGARAHPVRAKKRIPEDALGIGLFVHMHLRGRDMLVTAAPPEGEDESLLLVPNYNFDWQQSYRWPREGRRFAKGTVLQALAHYDNSAFNPFNPDPSATVGFGLETADEMMYAFLFWVAEHEQLGLDVDPANGHVVGGER
ncbi:MAG: redoxin family protein [Planctomycetes bacterium]|nr:redoxin family protein [Planctomycetota bacterium]